MIRNVGFSSIQQNYGKTNYGKQQISFGNVRDVAIHGYGCVSPLVEKEFTKAIPVINKLAKETAIYISAVPSILGGHPDTIRIQTERLRPVLKKVEVDNYSEGLKGLYEKIFRKGKVGKVVKKQLVCMLDANSSAYIDPAKATKDSIIATVRKLLASNASKMHQDLLVARSNGYL